MNLRAALAAKGNSPKEVDSIIESWAERILEGGEDPEELLYQEELEADYVMDLLDEC